MPYSTVADFGTAAQLKAATGNIKHIKPMEILTQKFGAKYPLAACLDASGKGVPPGIILDALTTLPVQLLGQHRLTVGRMNPTTLAGDGILNAATDEGHAAFAQLGIAWCQKLQQIDAQLPAQNVKKSLAQIYIMFGFTAQRLFQYYYAALRGQYFQVVEHGDPQPEDYDNYAFISPLPAYRTTEARGCDEYIRTLKGYVEKTINEYTFWAQSMGAAGDLFFEQVTLEANEELKCHTWVPTAESLNRRLPFPDFTVAWITKTDGAIKEWLESLTAAAKGAIESAKSTELYIQQMQKSKPTSSMTQRTFSTTTTDRKGDWVKETNGRFRNTVLDPSNTKPKMSVPNKCNMVDGVWQTKGGIAYKCTNAGCNGNHPSSFQGCTHKAGAAANPKSRPAPTKRKAPKRGPGSSGEVCRNYQSFGTCKYKSNCIHIHTDPPPGKRARINEPIDSTITAAITAAVTTQIESAMKCVCKDKDTPGHDRSICSTYAQVQAILTGQ